MATDDYSVHATRYSVDWAGPSVLPQKRQAKITAHYVRDTPWTGRAPRRSSCCRLDWVLGPSPHRSFCSYVSPSLSLCHKLCGQNFYARLGSPGSLETQVPCAPPSLSLCLSVSLSLSLSLSCSLSLSLSLSLLPLCLSLSRARPSVPDPPPRACVEPPPERNARTNDLCSHLHFHVRLHLILVSVKSSGARHQRDGRPRSRAKE